MMGIPHDQKLSRTIPSYMMPRLCALWAASMLNGGSEVESCPVGDMPV